MYNLYGMKGTRENRVYNPRGVFNTQRTQQAKNIIVHVKVTLEDLYNGRTVPIEFDRNVLCMECYGFGGPQSAAMMCNQCNGEGVLTYLEHIAFGLCTKSVKCANCNGMGHVFNKNDLCFKCLGNRTILEKKTLEVNVDKGMAHLQNIYFRQEGNQTQNHKSDVIVILSMDPHELFTRRYDNLYMNKTITLTEALCGFNLVVKQLDDRNIVIKSLPGQVICDKDVKCVKGEGMPMHKNPFQKGHLYVTFAIQYPDNHYAGVDQLKELEKYLPPRPAFVMPEGEDVYEVDLYEYNPAEQEAFRQAYESDNDDDERGARMHNGVECQTQ